MRRKFSIVLISLVAIISFSSNGFALDGKKLFKEKLCVNCHGESGIPLVKNYPILSGQNQKYLMNQTIDIISGKRKHGITVLMEKNPLLQSLEPKEVEAITLYLSELKNGLPFP
ncbi:MAG: c-type cytochrome [Deltaproteobacteria bacterium]|nr:c-type cytochrome [Deltaproteobacteria bacterium]